MTEPQLLVWVTIVCTMDLLVVTLTETQWYSIIVASHNYLNGGSGYVAKYPWHSQMFKVNILLHHLMLDVCGLVIPHVDYDVVDSESMTYHVAAIDAVLILLPVHRHHSFVLTGIREQFHQDALSGDSPRRDSQ